MNGTFLVPLSFFEMKNKKGQLGSLVPVVTTLIVIGLLIGVGLITTEQFRDQDALRDTSKTVTNESGAYLNGTSYELSGTSAAGANEYSMTAVWCNTTESIPYLVQSSNYSVDTWGVLTNSSGAPNVTQMSNCNVSYTYNYGETGWVGANSTVEAMTTIPDLLGLIILVVMVGILLAIVFNVMPMGRVSGA